MYRRAVNFVLRILDSRVLSRLRAVFFLGTTGVAALLVGVGVLLAVLKTLTHVGAVPLVFIGLGLFVLLASGFQRARGLRNRARLAVSQAHSDSDDELKAAMRELSAQIYEMLADRGEDDPSRIPWWHGYPEGASEEEKNRIFQRSTDRTIRYTLTTMDRYRGRFEGQALALFDEAGLRGWANEGKRHYFEHPTNPLGVEEVARTLGAMGHHR